ncbi:MAG: protein kinase [Thermoanaerobaculia bacterium]
MTLVTGTKLGPYEILAPIGAGGMGEVYRAKDTRLERTVAVKVLSQHLSSSPDVRQRFEREAKTISQLSHPHICALYDVGHEGDVEYLVMELLEGETLSDRLARGALPLEQTLRFGQEIADALEKAHRQGIVHRDLKPGNVMLTKSGVKLLDFGLAKEIAAANPASGATSLPTELGRAQNLTEKGTILGTFQYMSPEQLEGREADGRSDIFSFGAVLYEMASGQKAFSGQSQASLISAILRDDPQPISQAQPTSPVALDRVVRTCLAKDPEDRWQSAGDLKRELRWIGEGSQAGVSMPAAAAAARARASRLPWILAGALALAALALGGLVLRQRSARPQPIHAFLIPPPKTNFQLTGDIAAPFALSPDGSNVVFGAGGRLWNQSLRSGVATPLTGTEAALFPFWAPDSQQVAFFSAGKLRIADVAGGPVRAIADAPTPRGGAWGKDGTIVFSADFRGSLARVAASGGAATPVTRLDQKLHSTHRWPWFLSDGKHFVYLAASHANPSSENAGIYVASLDGGEPKRLMASYGSALAVPGWLLSVQDGNLMATPFDEGRLAVSGSAVRVASDVNFDRGIWRGVFSVSQNGMLVLQSARDTGRGQLLWVDTSGKVLNTIGERTEAFALRIAPDGRRASVVEGDPNNDIWIYDLERGVRTRLTTDAQVQMSPVWSPDGSEILFDGGERAIDADFTVRRISALGGGEGRVAWRSKERLEATDWSRDGRYALFDRGNILATDVWAYPLAEPEKAFPLVQTANLDGDGRFSPDGRWVSYMSLQSTRFEVYVTAFPAAGARWQVSASGGTDARWAPDGKTIYFLSLDNQVMAVPVDGSGAEFHVGKAEPLFPINVFVGPRISSGFEVAPDGKRFLVNSAGDVEAPRVVLISNWTSALTK